ncbi:MAG: 4Fe-4S binding protein [Coriobacteriia bacterium]|nr:4Fe-4S binding protein [Coriobacteriia bacterium]
MAEQKEMLPTSSGGLTRRTFVTAMGFGSLAVFSGVRLSAANNTPITADAKGVLFHESTRCVACHRCELACSEFNDGIASPHLARVKFDRNRTRNAGANFKWGTGQGAYGNWRTEADTCKQCPHPVPCAEACTTGAIKDDPATGARVIDTKVCIGCGVCGIACPWKMPTVNPETKKATKCFLCNGKPECARACPTGALRYISWRDLRATSPTVQSSWVPGSTSTDCTPCHKPI